MEELALERPPEDRVGWEVMNAGLKHAAAKFGARLEAAFAIGSLAHGGFAPAASDVDLALILSDLRDEDGRIVQQLGAAVREEIQSPLAQRLSVFWSTWGSLEAGEGRGRFPLVDRLDLAEAGVVLLGVDRRASIRVPRGRTLGDALVIEGAQFMRDKLAVSERNRLLLAPDELVALGCRDVCKAVLFPARFLLTLDTGEVGGNAAAARHLRSTCSAPVAALAAAAYHCRISGELEPAVMSQLLEGGLLPLYEELTGRYANRLDCLGEPDLAASMRRWRSDLRECAQP